jgi:methyltransferase-like protein/cyclopropane fatty-acyl-phospholipid synthase-like methyltransferase
LLVQPEPSPTATSYDELPYHSEPFPQTHPDRIATVATLFGLRPAPPENCRLLELGHGRGENILALAHSLPNSRFVGVELSRVQNDDAIAEARELGLSNVDLRHASILDVDESFGEFDYVICHGVFSWVPPEVRQKILDVCRRRLKPTGVGLVSYNVFPGWRLQFMVRDLMRIHSAQFQGRTLQVQQARAVLDFVANKAGLDGSPYAQCLKATAQTISQLSDSYLYHEHLDEYNQPLYFSEFAAMCTAHGLDYLGEVEFHTMLPFQFSEEAQRVLRTIAAEQVKMEQYLDFLRNRSFRLSLVVPAGATVVRGVSPPAVYGLRVAAPVTLKPPVADEANPDANQTYEAASGATLTVREPVLKAAYAVLSEARPQSMPFRELVSAALARLGRPEPPTPEAWRALAEPIAGHFLHVYCTNPEVVQLHVWAPEVANRVSERPTASRLARHLAARRRKAANQYLVPFALDDLNRLILRQLDGRATPADVVEAVLAEVAAGRLNVSSQGQAVTEPEKRRQVVEAVVNDQLTAFARHGFLVA